MDWGQGVKQDKREAVKWLRKAAEQGYALAQYNLGICYADGQGVKQDYLEAAKWYRRAAEQEFANAQFNLGACYYEGQGVIEDYTEAVKWYRKAAEQGNANAQYNLEQMYYKGQGVKQDYREAVKWDRSKMIIGVSLVFVAFVLVRFLFTCPKALFACPKAQSVLFHTQSVFYWGILIAGLTLTFSASIQIGLVALGCFLVLYNLSVCSMRMKAIPILANSLFEFIGTIVLVVGIVLSFLASLKLGFLVLAGCFVAMFIVSTLSAFESIVVGWMIEHEKQYWEASDNGRDYRLWQENLREKNSLSKQATTR